MHRRQASSRKRIREAAPAPRARRRAETTARKEALERLHEREQLFRSLLENSSDLMALLGADGTLLYVAPSCQRIMGYRSEDAVGRSGFERMHPEDQEPARRLLQWLAQRPGEQASVLIEQVVGRSVVEAHGGQLWFTANPVRGTTFRFTLPVENGQQGDGR